jgi:carbamoyl-phosphate synthase large subunit
MKKILIAGAGGAPSEGVIKSLLKSNKEEKIIGMGSQASDLILSAAEEKYLIPQSDSKSYKKSLLNLIRKIQPDFIHFQNDLEIYHASKFINEINQLGVKTYMPQHEIIDVCVHKYKSYLKFRDAGIQVPRNIQIKNEEDLKRAFLTLGNINGYIWLRNASIGGGGKGALPTNDFKFAKGWITHYNGWGDFLAAELLTKKTVTWLSLWHEGELVVAQTRIRKAWTHGNRAISGVTGVTKIGQTISDPKVDKIALSSIKAITNKPHGIFGVDMAYDINNIPNPTEINISRFFTTILFFTEAGLNMPTIFKDIALYGVFPKLNNIKNPLKDNLLWFRAMDKNPILVEKKVYDKFINKTLHEK